MATDPVFVEPISTSNSLLAGTFSKKGLRGRFGRLNGSTSVAYRQIPARQSRESCDSSREFYRGKRESFAINYLAQKSEPEMARDRFGFLERHGFVKLSSGRIIDDELAMLIARDVVINAVRHCWSPSSPGSGIATCCA